MFHRFVGTAKAHNKRSYVQKICISASELGAGFVVTCRVAPLERKKPATQRCSTPRVEGIWKFSSCCCRRRCQWPPLHVGPNGVYVLKSPQFGAGHGWNKFERQTSQFLPVYPCCSWSNFILKPRTHLGAGTLHPEQQWLTMMSTPVLHHCCWPLLVLLIDKCYWQTIPHA